MQRQVPTFQKFENSGSFTVTVLDKFVGIPAALQRHVPTNLSLLKTVELHSFLSLKTDWYSFSSDSEKIGNFCGEAECSKFSWHLG